MAPLIPKGGYNVGPHCNSYKKIGFIYVILSKGESKRWVPCTTIPMWVLAVIPMGWPAL